MPKSLKITLIVLAVIIVIIAMTFLISSGLKAFRKPDISFEPNTPYYYYSANGGEYIRIMNDNAMIRDENDVTHYKCIISDGNLIELTPTDTAQTKKLKGIVIDINTIYISGLRQYFYKEQ